MSNSTSATNSPSGKSEIITTPLQSRTGMAALKTWVDDMVDQTNEKVDPKDLARRLEKAKLNQIERWRDEAKEKQPSILHAIKIEIGHSMILQAKAIRTKKAIPNTWRDKLVELTRVICHTDSTGQPLCSDEIIQVLIDNYYANPELEDLVDRRDLLCSVLELEHYEFDLIATPQEKRDDDYSDDAWQVRLALDALLGEWGPEISREIWDLAIVHMGPKKLWPNKRQEEFMQERLGRRTMRIEVLEKMMRDLTRLSR